MTDPPTRTRAARIAPMVVMLVGLGAMVGGSAEAIVSDAATVEVAATRVIPPDPEGGLLFPIGTFPRCVVSNNFGGVSKAGRPNGHEGVDIGADEWQPVYAVEDGVLTRQLTDLGSAPGLGWVLLSDTDNEYRYYHLAGFTDGLEVGGRVRRGEVIGGVGSTGNAHPTGWHLHFEVRPGPQPELGAAEPVDPVPLLDIPDTCTIY